MKKKFLYSFILFFIPSILIAGPYDDMVKEMITAKKIEKNSTVAILPLNYSENPSVGELIAEELTRAMIKSGVKVVERRQLDKLIREISLQQTGLITDTGAAQIGKAAGAKYMILGSVAEFKKYGYANSGLKVSARLVEVATFNVAAVSTVEVDADDKVSPYRNKGVRRAAEYPCFLEFIGGLSLYSGEERYENLPGDKVNREVDFNSGAIFGLRYMNDGKGFFTRGYEINYQTFTHEDDDELKVKSYNLNFPFFIRIPLWVYMPALPQFTNLYFGPSFGIGIFKFPYYTGSKKDESNGFGFNTELIAGTKLGISENVSFNVEYRFKPGTWNPTWHSRDSDSYRTRIEGSMILIALSLAP